MCHIKTTYFLIRVSCISVLTMTQVHHRVMLAALSASTRFEKAAGAERWKPANQSCSSRSGEPKNAHVNKSSCPSSPVARVCVLPDTISALTALQNFTVFWDAYFFE